MVGVFWAFDKVVVSCPHVAEVFVVLFCPHFRLSDIYSLMMSSYPLEMIGSWPHVALVVVLICPHFHRNIPSPSPCTHIPVFRTTYYIYQTKCCTDSRSIFSQLKTVGRAKTLRAGRQRKGSTRRERLERKYALGWYGRDCRRGIWRG